MIRENRIGQIIQYEKNNTTKKKRENKELEDNPGMKVDNLYAYSLFISQYHIFSLCGPGGSWH